MDKKTTYDTYCGLSCKDCSFKQTHGCKGCIASKGKPFHGKCEVANCAISKGRGFCGDCAEFPCELLKRYAFDPDNGDNGERIENCKRIKTALVGEAREGIDPIAPCGFHCDHCMYTQWCGGCRSDYNVCSYATICDGKKCINMTCSAEKGLDGCYECTELANCKKGFYSNEDAFLSKAAALFIQKYDKERYVYALKKVIDKDQKSLDEAESVKVIIEMLESV